ncbi:sensor histidine kinase [Cohnella massiliensis]|uniref:sensor histidine kinase n=1 Tax=Cohnella massiliensis TaxID=1816691 RepID=UPI001FEB07B4|nr:sensor histidine kinase [Cohnella massiliensis]
MLVLSLWSVTAILLFSQPRSEQNRWAGGVAFFSVFGELSAAVDEKIIPLAASLAYDPITDGLEWVKGWLCFLAMYMPPYLLLMFGLSYTGWFQRRRRWKRCVIAVAFTPVLAMFFLSSAGSRLEDDVHPMPFWAALYYMTAAAVCLRLVYREADERIRQQHRLVCWIIVPATSSVLLFDFILPLLRFHPIINANRAVITAACICFYAFSVRYGILGVRLRLEKYPDSPDLHGKTPAIFMFYHAFKSELGKMQVAARRIFFLVQRTKQQELYRDASHLIDATERMMAIAVRFRHPSQQLVLYEQSCVLSELVENTLCRLAWEFRNKKLAVRKELDESIVLYCDPAHLQEVLRNLFFNAIEAMSEGGSLTISSSLSPETMDIIVRDTGCGIAPESMPHIFEPRFTTKSNEANDGMGLFYSHEVMRQHQGSIEVQSQTGTGTTCTLHFPIQRVFRHSSPWNRWEEYDEQDQSFVGGRRSGVERIYIGNGEPGTGFVFGRNGPIESGCDPHCRHAGH